MPIYPYRCAACGYETEVMRKISDPLLTTCPKCNSDQFSKQLTAPGFQLKGTGWYATDFKNSGSKSTPAKDAKKDDSSTSGTGDSASSTASSTSTDTSTAATPAPAASNSTSAPSSPPAA